ncbi:hypothetical protein F5876DRAFT_82097 [Lentinula aff. lateritia]|uniref:Uncharacterized protein n=1 Tax=Lentinula aff. lateritia TaxID=2804960 RepID=A0ACC1TKA0_9AGAR|nr:hypothetical protein F5876DRAFT_82097 [Lentinula aff. lateritia]
MARRSLRIQEKKCASDESQTQDVGVVRSSDSILDRKRAREDQEDQEYEEDPDDGEEAVPKRKKKKSKKAASSKLKVALPGQDQQSSGSSTKRQRMPEQFRKVRGRLGLLEKLAKDVPLDVILEIFCYLEPGDLLRLARTSRDLRDILMSKSSESIWRISRETMKDLPPLPDDLNEPQYAHLLFEPYCHICRHSGRCETVLWNFRMRACKKCALDTFPSYWDQQYTNAQPWAYRDTDVLPTELIRRTSHRSQKVGNFEIANQHKAEYEALPTEEDCNAWIARKRKERRVINEHARLCEQWHRARLNDRADVLSDVRRERKEEILNRLEEIGWRDEAEKIMNGPSYFDTFSDHKLVKQSKKLTEHGWRSIKDELVQFLSDRQADRVAAERNRILSARLASIQKAFNIIRSESDLREPFPSLGDIFVNKIFDALIRETPENEDLNEEFFHLKLLEHLPGMIDEWKPAKVQELVEVMQKSRPTATANDLYLATTIFECTGCYQRSLLHYPQMFYHGCCMENRNPGFARGLYFWHEGPWSSTRIVFSDARSEIAKTVIEACSLDPATATFEDMCDANPLAECQTCKVDSQSWEGGRLFMRWPLQLTHNLNHTLTMNSFNEQETRKIVACEPSYRSDADSICCAHCHKTHPIMAIVTHLKDQHSDVINLTDYEDSLKSQALRQHWYWNPRLPLRHIGDSFRFKEIPPPSTPSMTSNDLLLLSY